MQAWRTVQFVMTGMKHFTKSGYEKHAKEWAKAPDDVMQRSLRGRTAVVTGANQGIGFQASVDLARRGCKLIMVCRNQGRGEEARKKVQEASGNDDVHLHLCDVSSLDSIQRFVDELEAQSAPVSILVNNAGVMINEPRPSADGFETNFATNTLGTFALTRRMLPALRRGAPARVITVTSGGMLTEPLEVEDLEGKRMSKFDGTKQYARNKRQQSALCERMAEVYGRDEAAPVRFYTMHPGWTGTEGVKNAMPDFDKSMGDKFRTLEQGADTITWLALADEDKLEQGGFYLDRKPWPKHLTLARTSYSSADVDRLWTQLETMAGLVGTPAA
ncbi:unnamed protein product [Pedinophyceae sp. YPF-701]|nr:unnamed protein product [Pedinophyceae sp. YPF-701]